MVYAAASLTEVYFKLCSFLTTAGTLKELISPSLTVHWNWWTSYERSEPIKENTQTQLEAGQHYWYTISSSVLVSLNLLKLHLMLFFLFFFWLLTYLVKAGFRISHLLTSTPNGAGFTVKTLRKIWKTCAGCLFWSLEGHSKTPFRTWQLLKCYFRLHPARFINMRAQKNDDVINQPYQLSRPRETRERKSGRSVQAWHDRASSCACVRVCVHVVPKTAARRSGHRNQMMSISIGPRV